MPCKTIYEDGKCIGVICGFHPAYEFRGYLFEVHGYCGPTPLNRKTLDPRVNIPNGFWEMWEVFEKLSPAQKRKHLHEEA